jgi:L-ascorbate metabolism protein UlaG (beta-lactamase superfamily)
MRYLSRQGVTLVWFATFLLALPTLGAMAQNPPDRFSSEGGEIAVSQVRQMSVVISTPGGVIYTDPTGGKDAYKGHPSPDMILISHEHHEHFDSDTLNEIAGPDTLLIVPPFVMERLPSNLKGKAVQLANGQASTFGGIAIEAIPSYGLTGEAARWHPKGRGNGYVVEVDGRRIYIAGSTEGTPEMRQLKDIDIALLPLYPPYALGVDDALEAVSSIKPEVTYIYQYNSTRTRDEFVNGMKQRSIATTVIAHDIGSCNTLAFLCPN